MNNDKFSISIIDLTSNKKMYFRETTILFLLKGDLSLIFENQEHIITDGDILIFNPNDSVHITKIYREKCVLFELGIDNLFFSSLYPRYVSTKFECFPKQSKTGKRDAIYSLRKYLSELFIAHFSVDNTKDLRISMALNQILLILIQFFQKEDSYYNYHLYNEKIVDILKYLNENYAQQLILDEVADRFYMSPSALSKLFKNETGTYFSHYLNSIRIRNSLKDLLYTQTSVEEVALLNGFGSSKTYRHHFKDAFGQSPSTYRQNYIKSLTNKAENENSLKNDMTKAPEDVLASLYFYSHMPKEETSNIEVVDKHKKLSITTEEIREQIVSDIIIHVGTLEDLLIEDILSEIRLLKKNLDIKYLGIQNLFKEIPGSYTVYNQEKLPIFSPFAKFDRIFNFLEEEDIHIFYQISLTNYDAISAFYKQDRQIFLQHIENKKGGKFFKNWKINFQFNPYKLATEIPLFLEITDICSKINPAIQIGAEIPLKYPDYEFKDQILGKKFLDEVIPRCQFISFKSEPNDIYERSEDKIMKLDTFHEYVYKETVQLKRRLAELRIDLPLILTEWNTLTGKDRTINGAFFRGAIVLQEILKLDLLVQGYGFWLNTEMYERNQENTPIKYDGLELFHNYFGKRPAYYVLEIAARLKGQVRALGDEFMLLQQDDHYQLLLWNTNYFAPHLSLEESFLESQSVTISLEIPEINDGAYQVKQIDFNRHHGAIFYAYEEFKSRIPLDYESHVYLAESSRPKMKVFDVEVKDGLDFYCVLDTNAILLLELAPIKFLRE